MHSGTDFDLVVIIALWTGQIAVFATLAIIVFVLLSRASFNARQKQINVLITSWRPILAEVALAGHRQASVAMPKLARRNRRLFLHEWNALQESLTGEAQDRLNAFGRDLGLDSMAWQWLHHRQLGFRLLATATLGHMRAARAWQPLLKQLESRESLLSLMAARALAQIDAERAMPVIIPHILSRDDWTAGRVASILTRAGPEIVAPPLLAALAAATPGQARILLNFVRVIPASYSEETVRTVLESATDAELICACLKALQSPDLLPLARQLTGHEQWQVRLNAIAFLGRVGSRGDSKYLIRALQDREWWVRYRAAQALCHLPWIDLEKLRLIQRKRKDRFARDILEHVISEAGFE